MADGGGDLGLRYGWADLLIELGHRADLKQVKFVAAIGFAGQIHAKFDFYRSSHALLTGLQQIREDIRQRKQPVFEDGGEGEYRVALA